MFINNFLLHDQRIISFKITTASIQKTFRSNVTKGRSEVFCIPIKFSTCSFLWLKLQIRAKFTIYSAVSKTCSSQLPDMFSSPSNTWIFAIPSVIKVSLSAAFCFSQLCKAKMTFFQRKTVSFCNVINSSYSQRFNTITHMHFLTHPSHSVVNAYIFFNFLY